HHIDLAHQRPHRGLRLRRRPQLPAIVQVDAHARARAARRGDRGRSRRRRLLAERRRNPRHVKPPCAFHDRIPVDAVRRQLADGRMRAIVDDRRGALARAGLRIVDPDAVAATNDVIGPDAFCPKRADGGVADGVFREPRDVVAIETELREADGDVRFAAPERRREDRRLKQPLEPGRAQAKHDLAERDGFHRAAATLATSVRALTAIVSKSPRSIALVSTRAEPTPTAAAPALIQSPAFSSVTPPVGISFTCGSGARTSFIYCGPRQVAGNTFTMSAPQSCAARISVGEKQPGIAGTSRSWQARITSGRNTGPTTNVAPASMT